MLVLVLLEAYLYDFKHILEWLIISKFKDLLSSVHINARFVYVSFIANFICVLSDDFLWIGLVIFCPKDLEVFILILFVEGTM